MNPGLTYREAAAAGASPLRLVILLYQQAIDDLRRAIDAHQQTDIEGRTRLLNHAILIVGHLQSTLDKDAGGKVAVDLERFYNQLRAGLVEAQCRQSADALEQHLASLIEVHDAWCEVERSMNPSANQSAAPAPPAEKSSGGWNA